MDVILRSILVYVFILFILRMSGKRTLSEVTTFDFVLLLIIGEATEQALLSDDSSIIGALLVISTLVGMDVIFGITSNHFNWFNKVANGVPVIVFENGKPLKDRMSKANLNIEEILEAARKTQGIDSLDQVKYAVLEKDGGISIIPKS